VISTIWQEEKSRGKIQCNSCERIFCGKKKNQEKIQCNSYERIFREKNAPKVATLLRKGFLCEKNAPKLPDFEQKRFGNHHMF
jgi:hypothetical protein